MQLGFARLNKPSAIRRWTFCDDLVHQVFSAMYVKGGPERGPRRAVLQRAEGGARLCKEHLF
jgi:hypothetical protein